MRAVLKAWRKHKKEEKARLKAQEKSGGDPEAKRTRSNQTEEHPLTPVPPIRDSLLNQPLPPTPRHSGTVPTNKAGKLVQNGTLSALAENGNLSPDTQMAMDMVPRPTHRLGWVPFFGQKVDTIEWCKVRRSLRAAYSVGNNHSTLERDCPSECRSQRKAKVDCGEQASWQCIHPMQSPDGRSRFGSMR